MWIFGALRRPIMQVFTGCELHPRSAALIPLKVVQSVLAALAFVLAALLSSGNSSAAERVLNSSAPVVTERGPHFQRFEYVTQVHDAQRGEFVRTNSFVQLGTGLNRWDDLSNQWVPASDAIEMVNGFGIGSKTQHRVIFSPTTTHPGGLIDLETPAGERIILQPIGLAVTDATGRSVFLAEVQESRGEKSGPNAMLYRDAFDLVRASIAVKTTVDGIESDVILSERISRELLEELGVDAATAKLEVWHQVLKKPQFSRSRTELARRSGHRDEDETISFGGMSISSGTAFSIEDKGARKGNGPDLLVAKEFVQIDGLDFLIETIPFLEAEAELQALPEPRHAGLFKKVSVDRAVAAKGFPQRAGKERVRPVSLALNIPPSEKVRDVAMATSAEVHIPGGYVIDYPITLTTHTNFTFRSDTTYLVTNRVLLHGLTRLEGGAVIKTVPYDANIQAQVKVMDDFECLTSPYNPAIFTARDDDTVGEIVPESTGVPATNLWYAFINLGFSGTRSVNLHDIQTRYAHAGIYVPGAGPHQISNVQVFQCYRGIEFFNSVVNVRNVLLHHTRYAFNPIVSTLGAVNAEHVTVDTAANLFGNGQYGVLYLTNSILCDVVNGNTNVFKDHVETVTHEAFQVVGRGRHYLTEESGLRDSGSTNISVEISEILRQTTTFAPEILSEDITSDSVLAPRVTRDSDLPDLGYHYYPLDFLASGIRVTNATLRLKDGVAVGVYGASGFELNEGGRILSAGRPTRLNRIALYNAVQCEPVAWGDKYKGMFRLTSPVAELDFRLTESSVLAATPDRRLFIDNFAETTNSVASLRMRDCRLANFAQNFRTLAPSGVELNNNLFERCNFVFEQGTTRGKRFAPLTLTLYNNLFWNGTLLFTPRIGTTPWIVRDNFFQNETLVWGLITTNFTPDFNAFGPFLSPNSGSNNVVDVSATFVPGALGRFYYSTNGSTTNLVNAGSRSAKEAGLYHQTTNPRASSREGNTIVNIGFHYPSLDAEGALLDADEDGVADWDEDENGNGEYDPGEMNLMDRDTDLDGDSDSEELLAGTDPTDSGSVTRRSLAAWRFDGTDAFIGDGGQTPTIFTNVSVVPGVVGKGAKFATDGLVKLQYKGVENDGRANVSLAQGAVRFRLRTYWFSNDPSLDLPGLPYTFRGVGPQEWVTLFETTNVTVKIDPDGTNIFVMSRKKNGQVVTNLQASLKVEPEDPRPRITDPGISYIYDVLVNYSPEETSIYWGAPGVVARGSGIEVWDGPSDANKFLSIGAARNGVGSISALLDEIVVYNAPGILHTNPWQFSAIALSNTPALNLVWGSDTNLVVDIQRRELGGSTWEFLPGAIGTNFVDTTVTPGVRYEYNLNTGFRQTNGIREDFGNFMTASVLGSAVEKRGKVILLVDETLVPELGPEINSFATNLVGDGWGVLRANVARHVDSYVPPEAHQTNYFHITNSIAPFIRSNYTVFSTNIKHILIVGHVVIPYTGDNADDGHYQYHQGAWASDIFYGDVDGIWNDTKVQLISLFPENHNKAGDGKFDEDYLPPNAQGVAELEIPVARIDFARLPQFYESEVDLIRRYLVKNARYRNKDLTFAPAAIGRDFFLDWRSTLYPEQMAAEFASKVSCLGPFEQGDVFTNANSFVLGVQAGSGYVDRINDSQPREQTTVKFATGRTRPSCAFYFLRASYFPDWNLQNNFMRAVLTPENGGLAAGWFLTMGVWRPDYLGAGLELGMGLREVINTRMKKFFWYGQTARSTEILGDSTLRYPILAPPSGLTRSVTNGTVLLNWSGSIDPDCAYNVYRSNYGINGDFVRLNAAPLATTSFSDRPPPRVPAVVYMVRAARLDTTGSGSFTNLSQGIFIAR